MASVQLDPASGLYRLCFRFGGKGYFRSLKTQNEGETHSLCGQAEAALNAISQGFLSVPPGTDPADFTLAGDKSIQPSIARGVRNLESHLGQLETVALDVAYIGVSLSPAFKQA